MLEEIICAGFGGQGVMLMGKLLALGGLQEDKQVTWLPSYGAEVRGGTAHCMVKISDEEIASPFIKHSDTCFVMNQLAFNKFGSYVKENGLMIINSSLVKRKTQRKKIKIISLPLTQIASSLGNIKVANTVALGVYIANKKIIKLKSMLNAMEGFAGKDKRHLLKINEKALREGQMKAQLMEHKRT
ncbi:MAG: 2-oxoacid:acceptor oxidoreductase family protein [Candidatus Omnitrophica bacterium]|nr:2-oxoacid:acceptor oxidoreductase family protein [Candidatus Omnitrophota bacterium]